MNILMALALEVGIIMIIVAWLKAVIWFAKWQEGKKQDA